jgi:hypothetical protein
MAILWRYIFIWSYKCVTDYDDDDEEEEEEDDDDYYYYLKTVLLKCRFSSKYNLSDITSKFRIAAIFIIVES